jgi:5S rRNA maturation endonuclease (ribonuclease M5)
MEFKFLVKPQITKEYILSKVSQESIFNFYTGMEVTSKKLQLSPFRADNKVTCAYYRSKNDIVYLHDFATNEHISCFEAVMRLYNLTYWEALNKIAADFKLLDNYKSETQRIEFQPELKETESANIQCKIKDFTEDELKWWNQFGISKKLLKKFHVFSIEHVFLNGELKFTSSSKSPIYGYYFGKDKNKKEQWKIYFPLRTSGRFIGNLKKKVLQGYQQLPETGELLVITKSMKDTVALKEFGIPSVSPNSETIFLSDKQIEEFKKRFKHILVVFDNDRPGLYNLAKIRKQYPNLNYYFLPKNLAKDFTDSIKKIGVEKMRELLVKFLINYKFK